MQPSHPPAGQGQAHHATDPSFCVSLLKAPASASTNSPWQHQRSPVIPYSTDSCVALHTHTIHTSLSFQHFIHLCRRTKRSIYFQTCSVSAFSEPCLVLLCNRAIVFVVPGTAASLLFANSLPRDMMLHKQMGSHPWKCCTVLQKNPVSPHLLFQSPISIMK